MQAVMFVAGRGTRMGSLTDSMPKPMLSIAGKPILEYKLEALPDRIDEVVLVVGYLGSVIQKHFGGEYQGKKIYYVEQEDLSGTADALWKAQSILRDSFIAMNGDDLYAKEDLEACMEHEWTMLVQQRNPIRSGGKVVIDARGSITAIEEGTHEGAGLVNAGAYMLDTRAFSCPLIPKAPGSPEFGLPQTILAAADTLHIGLEAVPTTFWIQITEPKDLQRAEEQIKQRT